MKPYLLLHGDCLDIMRGWEDDSVDLIVGSPPYEDARTYGIGFKLKGQAWVDWMVERMLEMLRVCSGFVAMVVEGRTQGFKWSATPALLIADLHRAGVCMRKPPIYKRDGVAGSGSVDYWRNRYEFIVVCTRKPGRLRWSDNTATGHPPKCKPGGRPSSRGQDGKRKRGNYKPPKLSNPGNIIDCGADTQLGFGNETDAPFHPNVPRAFVRCFCPPGGIVYDPFLGSGTTGEEAIVAGRQFVGSDVREDQLQLTERRFKALRRTKGFGV